jgi:N-acyl-phosphatidylethanolamine-hydrolysing phospholipase D
MTDPARTPRQSTAESVRFHGGLSVVLPFFARRARVSLFPRPGAAPRVPFDPAALLSDPGVTWIGHATLLVRMEGATFLTDPMFSKRASPLPFAGPPRLVEPGVPLEHLPRVDFAVLSHDHYDHTDARTIRALASRGTRFIVPTGMGALLRGWGAAATELAWWEHTTCGPLRVHCVPARHFSGRTLTDRNRRLWSGWVVEAGTRRFYFAGDTAYFPGFEEIGARLGPPDLAAVPVGAYLPEAMMKRVHVTPEEALRGATEAGARRVLGMHFGTFDLTDEPLDEPPLRFRAEAARLGIKDPARHRLGHIARALVMMMPSRSISPAPVTRLHSTVKISSSTGTMPRKTWAEPASAPPAVSSKGAPTSTVSPATETEAPSWSSAAASGAKSRRCSLHTVPTRPNT